MLDVLLGSGRGKGLKVLCIGAHADDIEIGCGATLLALRLHAESLTVDWVVMTGGPDRQRESVGAMRSLVRPAGRGAVIFGGLADGRLPTQYGEAKDLFESLKRQRPDVVFCHERGDRHQDHRIVNELAWSTFRDHLILEYEVPKWDGGLGSPNVYVPVGRRQAEAKVAALLRHHRSQAGKDWFTRETFLALMRLRGVECRSPSGFAEAFHGRKLRLGAS